MRIDPIYYEWCQECGRPSWGAWLCHLCRRQQKQVLLNIVALLEEYQPDKPMKMKTHKMET